MRTAMIATKQKREVVDITDEVAKQVPAKGEGAVTVFVRHTTAAVTTADLDPGTDKDFLNFLEAITPQVQWRHPHNPAHTPDHLLASLIGPSATVSYKNGELLLGAWQRVVLIELDGPRDRDVLVHVL